MKRCIQCEHPLGREEFYGYDTCSNCDNKNSRMEVLAIFTTRHFEFIAHGENNKDAYSLLVNAWKLHCKSNIWADPNYLKDNFDSVVFIETKIGVVTESGEPFYERP